MAIAVTATYSSNGTPASESGSTFTWAAISIGAAASDRIVVVGVTHRSADSITSATIGGVSATVHATADRGLATSSVISAAVPTGTTADVVITFNAAPSVEEIQVWRMTGAEPTAVDTAISAGFNAQSVTIDMPANGAGFASALIDASADVTWAGLTEDADFVSGARGHSFASVSGASANASYSISTSWTSAQRNTIAAVTFEEAAAGGTDNLLADDVESASEVTSPSIGQEHGLTATSVQAASEVTAPALGQVHVVAANDVEAASEVSTPALGIIYNLTADDVESASEVTTPAIGQVHALTAGDVESASEVTTPALGQVHVLAATDVESASELTTPALAENAGTPLLAEDVEAASEVTSPALGQVHVLSAVSIEAASQVSSPEIGQIHQLAADDLESASEVTAPSLVEGVITPLTAEDVEAASEVTSPALGQVHVLQAANVEAASEVTQPTLTLVIAPGAATGRSAIAENSLNRVSFAETANTAQIVSGGNRVIIPRSANG